MGVDGDFNDTIEAILAPRNGLRVMTVLPPEDCLKPPALC